MIDAPQGTVLVDEVIPYNTGRSYTVKKGQHIRVIGKTTVDLVVFNLDNLRERFDQGRTRSNQAKIFISKGDVLISRQNDTMLTIVEDTWPGRHDLQKGMCSRKRHEMVFRGEAKRSRWGGGEETEARWEDIPSHGCWENLTEALKEWDIGADDLPSPWNIFQNMRIDGETGQMWWDTIIPPEEAYVDMMAEMNCLVGASNCPSGKGLTTRIQIYEP